MSLMAFVPGAVGQVMSPRIMRAYGGGRSVTNLLRQPILLLSLVMPIMGGLGAARAPFVITRILPSFTGAIVPSLILLLSYTPFAARSFAAEVLVASDLIYRVAIPQVLGLILAVTVCGWALVAEYGIAGVAVGMAAMYWFFGISIIATAECAVQVRPVTTANLLARVLLPTIWMAGLVVFGIQAATFPGISKTELGGTGILVGLVTAGSVPLFLVAWIQFRRLMMSNSEVEE